MEYDKHLTIPSCINITIWTTNFIVGDIHLVRRSTTPRNLRERDHWGDQDVDGRIILRWIIRKWEGVVGTGWSWLRIGTGSGRL